MMSSIERHQTEIHQNLHRWQQKPLLRRIYRDFYREIASCLPDISGPIVELGSGAVDITEEIPDCLRTDLFFNPWIDLVENAYRLPFAGSSLAGLILFDVFHHLRYPGTALKEFQRVLTSRGRVILFEPAVSLLGRLLFGPLHPEPLALDQPLTWSAPGEWSPGEVDYYAAQGNASRIFIGEERDLSSLGWSITALQQFSALSYAASGGYSRPQVYPALLYPLLRWVEKGLDLFPSLFATRLLVVLEKMSPGESP